MPRGMSTLAEFTCFTCSRPLGWTSPGEAKRMNIRAHVFCEVCKDTPVGLTDRQQQLVDCLAAQKARGETPTLSKAAEEMNVSRSRVQQIKDAIKARGVDNEIDAVLYGLPTTVPDRMPPRPVEVTAPVEQSDDWSYAIPEYTPPASSTHDSDEDPAVFGGEFVV